MTIEFIEEKLKPIVTLNKKDIETAFKSEYDFQLLLHEITRKCYGDFIANICFPINEVKE